MTTSQRRSGEIGSTISWIVWLVATSFFVYSVLGSVLFALLSQDVQRTLGLDTAQLGMLSAILFGALAVGQLFAGTLADRTSTRFLLSGAAAAAATGTLMFAATTLPSLAAAGRLLGGLGMAFSFVGAAFVARMWFPPERYAFMVGLSQTFANVASGLIAVGFAQFTTAPAYREVFIGMAVVGGVIAVLCLLLIKRPPDSASTATTPKTSPSILEGWKITLCNPQIWLCGVYFGCMFGALLAYADLSNIPFQISFGNPLARAAEINSGIPFGVAIGSLCAGWIAGRSPGPLPPARIFPIGAAIAMAAILALPVLSFPLAVLLHLVFGFFLGGSILAFPMASTNCPAQVQGTAIGFVTTLGYTGGALIQSVVGAELHSFRHLDNTAYTTAYWVFPAVLLIAAALTIKMHSGSPSESSIGAKKDAHR